MTNPMIREYDKDNNLVDRPMNDAEFIQYQADQASWAKSAADEVTLEALKASGIAKLTAPTRVPLTSTEAEAMGL